MVHERNDLESKEEKIFELEKKLAKVKNKKTFKRFGSHLMAILLGFTLSSIPAGYDFSFERSQIYGPSKTIKQGKITDNKNGTTYALLINGKKKNTFDKITFKNYSRNIKDVYNCLTKNNIPDSNIYVLNPEKFKEFKGKYFKPFESGLKKALNELSDKIDSNDKFIFYLTNHGGKTGIILPYGESMFPLTYQGLEDIGIFNKISETKFKKMVKKINPKYSVMVFSQCFSGGFAKCIGKNNNIGISKSTPFSSSSGYGKDPIVKYFFPAMFGDLSLDERKKADFDKDNNISIKEAFQYTAEKDGFANPFLSLPFFPFKNTYQLYYKNKDPSKLSFDKN